MSVSFEELRLGGYFLTRSIARPAYVAAELMPPEFISMSGCLASFAPDVWSLAWASVDEAERLQRASEMGVQPGILPELISAATAAFDHSWGWPNVIYDLMYAREFARRFLADTADLRLIGAALPSVLVPQFLDEAKPGPCEGTNGLFERLSNQIPPEPGNPIGWEILGFEYTPLHSWLCNGLEREVFEKLGISPATNGLIQDRDSALKAAEYCGMEGVGAEPALWRPWLLIEYPLSGS